MPIAKVQASSSEGGVAWISIKQVFKADEGGTMHAEAKSRCAI